MNKHANSNDNLLSHILSFTNLLHSYSLHALAIYLGDWAALRYVWSLCLASLYRGPGARITLTLRSPGPLGSPDPPFPVGQILG